MSLSEAVEKLISETTGAPAKITRRSGAGGGCINAAETVTLEDGRTYFVKSNPAPLPGMFEREAEALAALADAGSLRVPRPLGVGGGSGGVPPFLVMEHIPSGQPKAGFAEDFGRKFARLHQEATADRFGFEHDNYLGSTPQPNTWTDDWVDFWREHRLGFQVDLARRNGHADSKMSKLADTLSERLDDLIGQPNDPPSLLHGDLWSGNYLADDSGEPVLIDPAAYCGRREADLAMTRLFGGFGHGFYEAYDEVWPLEDGAEVRNDIYQLYHLMNHLNLFGGSYLGSCMAILRRYGG